MYNKVVKVVHNINNSKKEIISIHVIVKNFEIKICEKKENKGLM